MNYCPYCNWEIVNGKCSNWSSHCDYKGPGLTSQQREDNAKGYQLGQLSPGDSHNGAGCYDADTDFS